MVTRAAVTAATVTGAAVTEATVTGVAVTAAALIGQPVVAYAGAVISWRRCRRGGVYWTPHRGQRQQWQHGRTGNRPDDVAGVADTPGRGLEHLDGGRGMVVDAVEKEACDRLYIGFGAPIHPHHAFLKERHDLQVRQPLDEDFLRRPPSVAGVGHGTIKAVSGPNDSLEPQLVTVGADFRDSGEIDAQTKPPNLATGRMAALHGSRDALSTTTFCCGLPGAVY